MDTCGIFNLHGIPGIIAFICGAISISTYDSELNNLPFALNSIEVRLGATRSLMPNISFFSCMFYSCFNTEKLVIWQWRSFICWQVFFMIAHSITLTVLQLLSIALACASGSLSGYLASRVFRCCPSVVRLH
jgi:hypothetical protein